MNWANYTPSEIHALARQADLLAEGARDRRLAEIDRANGTSQSVGGRLGCALSRLAVGALRRWPDSRPSLRSPEQELAARGVAWASDPGHDLDLARELRLAQWRRAHRALVPVLIGHA